MNSNESLTIISVTTLLCLTIIVVAYFALGGRR